jgi:hypothetical protein
MVFDVSLFAVKSFVRLRMARTTGSYMSITKRFLEEKMPPNKPNIS